MRLVIELRRDQTEAEKRHMCIVKANYLPEEYKTESFVLQFDENMTFTMTKEKKAFNELRPDNKSDLQEVARKMKEEGITQTEIGKKLKISQATVWL